MKAHEIELILLLAFEHTPESRAQYFKIEADRLGYSYPLFWSELFEAYKRFEAVVNSTDFRTYETNEPGGEKHFHKKVIFLGQITGGRLPFTLNSENLTELFIPLRDFGALVLPKTITQPTSTPPAKTPPAETPADKIRTILEPLRGAFADTTHIDRIIEAMQTGVAPDGFHCENLQVENKDFYPFFKTLHNETDLTFPLIAEILHRFIYSNNGSRNAIQPTAINQNMKRKYN